MKNLFTIFAALMISCSGIAQETQTLPRRTAGLVDEAIVQQMKLQNAVGVAVGIIQDGKIAYIKSYGYEDLEHKIPVSSETMFRWASVSKTLTAIAALQLVEGSKLDLSADVRLLVPEFPDKQVVITPRDLLCHQSGIVHYSNGRVVVSKQGYSQSHPFENVVTALDTFKESPLVNQPQEKYSYSTHAYILLSAVVERAGQQKFAEQIHDRIVEPLKLKTLRPDYQWERIPHRAIGYRTVFGKVAKSTDTDVSWKLGGGGYISNIDDFAIYAAAVMNGDLLSPTIQEQMWTPQKTRTGETTPVGLGVMVDGTGPQLRISHSGSQEKSKTRMVLYPNRKSGVVVMSNSENVNPGDFSTAVFRALSMAN